MEDDLLASNLLSLNRTNPSSSLTLQLNHQLQLLNEEQTLSPLRRDTTTRRIHQLIHHVLSLYPHVEIEKRPVVFWRTLNRGHHSHNISAQRVQTIDVLTRSIVERLISQSSSSSSRSWKHWISATIGREVVGKGRLSIIDWGSKILGLENRLMDDIHPAMYPGSWMFGQMLLHELKLSIEGSI